MFFQITQPTEQPEVKNQRLKLQSAVDKGTSPERVGQRKQRQ